MLDFSEHRITEKATGKHLVRHIWLSSLHSQRVQAHLSPKLSAVLFPSKSISTIFIFLKLLIIKNLDIVPYIGNLIGQDYQKVQAIMIFPDIQSSFQPKMSAGILPSRSQRTTSKMLKLIQ